MEMLVALEEQLGGISGIIWGPFFLLPLILGTGLFLMIRLRAMPLRNIGYGFRQLFSGTKAQGEGEISPFAALMTSLSATIGTGNIAGVATAITLGGPGALFWMWCSALVGMATKYAEGVCAVHYRETDTNGHYVGGPMYYIRNGLGRNWRWLAVAFAFFGALAGFGIGNGVQANSVADALAGSFDIAQETTALVIMAMTALVLLGGIKRISEVASFLVPIMALLYLLVGLTVIVANIQAIPDALATIVIGAFNPQAVGGGAAGVGIMLAIQFGVARGVFSNEAGLGSAPIAHAAAATNNPVRQGTVAMLGTFIDTLIICTITGLCIVVSGAWQGEAINVAMTKAAFSSVFSFGDEIVAVGLAIFAFTTILGWSYYSERCAQYLLGPKVVYPFRIIWVAVIWFGATSEVLLVWTVADILNGLMAVPNLLALLLLSGVVAKLTRDYFESQKA
ncbi:sodium:alanine symporter family protein [Maricurvus nonylphenolicus]|uniref:alanine/glycine:cation symporter family protein n=1 Tax=Maricurvus nonylphenolicus TaxID=1008307 RepID=UPI0036F42EB3